MKEFVIIILIVVLIFTGDFIVQSHLEATSSNMVSKLENLKEKVIKSKETEDKTGTEELLREVEDEWNKTNKTWSVIVVHEELDSIEEALVKAKSSIAEGELEDRFRRNRNSIIFHRTCKRKRKSVDKKYFLVCNVIAIKMKYNYIYGSYSQFI